MDENISSLRKKVNRLEKVLEIQQRFAMLSGFLDDNISVKSFLDQLAEGLILVDSEGLIVLANHRAGELLGYEDSDLSGRHLNAIIPVRFHKAHKHMTDQFFRNPRHRPMGQGMSMIAKRKDGSELPVDISLSFLKTSDDMYAMAFIHDISVQKNKERELLERNKELNAYNRSVAHDINSSLGAIVGLSDNLADGYDLMEKQEVKKHLELISESARKLSVVVKEILFLTQVEKDKISFEKLNMPVIVRQTIDRLTSQIERSKAVIHIPESFVPSWGYSAWVEELWYNLIDNAIKYGGAPPEIRLGSRSAEKGKAGYWIEDNGTGIEEEIMKQILSDKTVTRKASGHGIGISIINMILRKLNGSLHVERTAEGGTRFEFTLPDEMPQISKDPSVPRNHP